MMLYDVLCLKSILGFLLSERTSGVSPVIFYFQNTETNSVLTPILSSDSLRASGADWAAQLNGIKMPKPNIWKQIELNVILNLNV